MKALEKPVDAAGPETHHIIMGVFEVEIVIRLEMTLHRVCILRKMIKVELDRTFALFFNFFSGGMDIHYTSATITTSKKMMSTANHQLGLGFL